MSAIKRIGILATVLTPLCACGGGEAVNITSVPPSVQAGCSDQPTPALLMPSANGTMLPGWDCLYCHTAGGQAGNFPYTAAGTIFSSTMTRTCDIGGISGVLVEILDSHMNVQASATTNASGNFFIDTPLTYPLTARIRLGDMMQTDSPQSTGDCASCHQYPVPRDDKATGRIWLN